METCATPGGIRKVEGGSQNGNLAKDEVSLEDGGQRGKVGAAGGLMMKRAEIEKAVEPTENTDSAEKHDEGAETGRAIHRKVWLALAGGIGLIFLALLPPGIYSVDGNGMLAVAESLVAHHSLNVPPDLGMAGRGGLFFGKWYPLQSLLAVPFVAAGTAAAHLLHLPPHYVAAIFSLVLPVAFTAATTALVALIALQLGSSWEGALLAAMTYAFGTVAMVYARSFYAEPSGPDCFAEWRCWQNPQESWSDQCSQCTCWPPNAPRSLALCPLQGVCSVCCCISVTTNFASGTR